jgi:hypothetical protein
MKPLGKMKISEVYPIFQIIAKQHGLNLNRLREFNMVKNIFINRYLWN